MKIRISCIAVTQPFRFLRLSLPRTVKATFRESKPGFYQTSILRMIVRSMKELNLPEYAEPLWLICQDLQFPIKLNFIQYKQWHNAPISQGNTGTCWCFSTTSFLESEATV